MGNKHRYKCPACKSFVAETDTQTKVIAYCKRCRDYVEGVEFKRKRPRI